MDPIVMTILAAVGAGLTGSFGREVLGHLFGLGKSKIESNKTILITEIEAQTALLTQQLGDLATFRKDLMDEVQRLSERVELLHQELDIWKRKYYELLGEHTELKTQYAALLKEAESLRKELDALRKRRKGADA